MIKIIATVNKKIPIAGTDFSNNQASITLEAETTSEKIKEDIQRLFKQAEDSVDVQLKLTSAPESIRAIPSASEKQLALIRKKAPDLERIKSEFAVSDIAELSVHEASDVIKQIL